MRLMVRLILCFRVPISSCMNMTKGVWDGDWRDWRVIILILF